MSLLLHCGSDEATLGDLESVRIPAETASYKPLGHADLARMLATQAADLLTRFQLHKSSYGLTRDGQRMFGVHTFRDSDTELGLCIGFRNSYDRSMSIGIAVGASVFVCDNLAFTGDISVLRKHTRNVIADIEMLSLSAIYLSRKAYQQIRVQSQAMREAELQDEEAFRLLGALYGRGILTPRQIPVVKREWRSPQHEDFKPRTLWSFYNSVSESLKTSPPQQIMERHLRLHQFIGDEIPQQLELEL